MFQNTTCTIKLGRPTTNKFGQFTFRLAVSGLHYNENSNREQAVTKDGEQKYSMEFPKQKGGEPKVRRLKTKPTYGELICAL